MPPLILAVGPLVLAAAASATPVVEAPITRVTVFSDRARVQRTAVLPGAGRFELPLLGDRIDPASIRVELAGAELRRVDLSHVDAEDFPEGEARALVEELEKLDDRIARTEAMRAVPQALQSAVRAISPTLPPAEPMRPVTRLNPAGWGASMSFVDGWLERMQGRARQEAERLVDLRRERARLSDKARVLGASGRRSGHRVVVHVGGGGGGKVKLTATYMALGARWAPSYDIQLLSDGRRVQVAFAGLVSQETGEDWNGAELVLSTAVPATATVLPKILTWKIGERDRFIPTPVPVAEVLRPPPRAVPPLLERADNEALKARLRQLAGGASPVPAPEPQAGGKDGRADYDRAGEDLRDDEESVPPPPPPPPPGAYPAAPAYAPAPRRVPAAKTLQEKRSADAVEVEAVVAASEGGRAWSPPPPREAVGLSPPPGYQPPYYGPDLPVSLAGGNDLSFSSLRPETVQSGKGARRVALFSQQWPVEVERRLFPALAPEAYVTAEIKNPSPTALPGGTANLAVGDDPAGTASLGVVGSGETFVLPLGLDRALKPVRNVKLVQSEKGVFSKDDIGEYTVTIEIANPYAAPTALRVFDQIPLTDDKNVEIKALAMEPAPVSQDKLTGALEWRVTVPASGKSVIKFGYSVRRPKGWRLHQ